MTHQTKSPEVQNALRVVHEQLFYVVQVKDPTSEGETSEWSTRADLGAIQGKSGAYDIMEAQKLEAPTLRWRVLKKNEADKYEEGIQAGRRLERMHRTHRHGTSQ
jgi:hypothetical protein